MTWGDRLFVALMVLLVLRGFQRQRCDAYHEGQRCMKTAGHEESRDLTVRLHRSRFGTKTWPDAPAAPKMEPPGPTYHGSEMPK